MKFSSKRMVEEALKRIDVLQGYIAAIDSATSYIYNIEHSKIVDSGSLRKTLIEMELGEWRHLFLWGITLDQAERDRIKLAGYQRFIKDIDISPWLNNGIKNSSYLTADKEEFLEMAAHAFAPSEG